MELRESSEVVVGEVVHKPLTLVMDNGRRVGITAKWRLGASEEEKKKEISKARDYIISLSNII